MIRILHIGLISCALLLGCSDQGPGPARGSEKVGTTSLAFIDHERQRPLALRLWYPAEDAAVEQPQNYHRAFLGHAALEAGFKGGPRPLALLSHGDKGNNAN